MLLLFVCKSNAWYFFIFYQKFQFFVFFIRYKPPIKPTTSRWSLELPESLALMEEELQKQESLLNALHAEINAGCTDEEKEEQLWEVQRVVTQLKRKVSQASRNSTQT